MVTWANQILMRIRYLMMPAIRFQFVRLFYGHGSGNSGNIINLDINGLERPAPAGSDPDIGAYENLGSTPDVWLT
ncbi:MAG: hypothetical protein CM1200mP10_23290 [Candidatus Neomarinimicrobiota bacterium]|nr:MAG: hypothetical protein CM1200mP10_23290 [Candidatus Neomarinimicrobiota bacterium]